MYFCVFCFVERRVQNICSHRIFTFYLFFYIYYGGDKRGGDVGWRGGGAAGAHDRGAREDWFAPFKKFPRLKKLKLPTPIE